MISVTLFVLDSQRYSFCSLLRNPLHRLYLPALFCQSILLDRFENLGILIKTPGEWPLLLSPVFDSAEVNIVVSVFKALL